MTTIILVHQSVPHVLAGCEGRDNRPLDKEGNKRKGVEMNGRTVGDITMMMVVAAVF